MKYYATVTGLLMILIVSLLALATVSALLGCSRQVRTAAVEPIPPVAPAPTGPMGEHAPKAPSPGTGSVPRAPDSPGRAEEPRQKKNAPPSKGKQDAAPALDVASLEKRLRETKAIGVFTKLSLKSQVDDLREQFRRFHEGRAGATLAELRERYDLLLLKVLALLQDGDPPLARDISASREVLWSFLADPIKFRNL